MDQTIKSGIFGFILIGLSSFASQSYAEENNDFVDHFSKIYNKCSSTLNAFHRAKNGDLQSTGNFSSCGPIVSTLSPSGATSLFLDVSAAGLKKNGILSGAAPYASEQEAGRSFDETGAALLNAAHEYVQSEYGLDDPHEINRRIIEYSKAKAKAATEK